MTTTHTNKPVASIEFTNFSNSGYDPLDVSEESVLVNSDGWYEIIELLTNEQKKVLLTKCQSGAVISHCVRVSDRNF